MLLTVVGNSYELKCPQLPSIKYWMILVNRPRFKVPPAAELEVKHECNVKTSITQEVCYKVNINTEELVQPI